MLSNLPDSYRFADEDRLAARILAAKDKMGGRLVILAHHYQRSEIVQFADYIGDSYGLSRTASRLPDAEHIVFCGVRFMAEAARVLCREDQKVYLANPLAGCPMADMGPIEAVNQAWERINEFCGRADVIPISYMNTSTELKAFTGKNRGLICTSSNAREAFKWALDRAERLFFFPDQHLGKNTSKKLGLGPAQVYLYDREEANAKDISLKDVRVILWPGFCYVHTKFSIEQIRYWRLKEPEARIVVHPECREEVVDAADAVGSTSFIVNYVDTLPPGSIVAIATELNLVSRLARTHQDKRIFELADNNCPVCSNMFRTTLADLCYAVENLDAAQQVTIEEEIGSDAKIALERMLEIGG